MAMATEEIIMMRDNFTVRSMPPNEKSSATADSRMACRKLKRKPQSSNGGWLRRLVRHHWTILCHVSTNSNGRKLTRVRTNDLSDVRVWRNFKWVSAAFDRLNLNVHL